MPCFPVEIRFTGRWCNGMKLQLMSNRAGLSWIGLAHNRAGLVWQVLVLRDPRKRCHVCPEFAVFGSEPAQVVIEMIRWTDLAPWEFEFPFLNCASHSQPAQSFKSFSTRPGNSQPRNHKKRVNISFYGTEGCSVPIDAEGSTASLPSVFNSRTCPGHSELREKSSVT